MGGFAPDALAYGAARRFTDDGGWAHQQAPASPPSQTRVHAAASEDSSRGVVTDGVYEAPEPRHQLEHAAAQAASRWGVGADADSHGGCERLPRHRCLPAGGLSVGSDRSECAYVHGLIKDMGASYASVGQDYCVDGGDHLEYTVDVPARTPRIFVDVEGACNERRNMQREMATYMALDRWGGPRERAGGRYPMPSGRYGRVRAARMTVL